jgi:hypothetical protein
MAAATARMASRVPARPRLRHAVEIAQTVMVAVLMAAVVIILLRAWPRERSDVDVTRGPAAAELARA